MKFYWKYALGVSLILTGCGKAHQQSEKESDSSNKHSIEVTSPDTVLDQAIQLAEHGKWDESLKKFIWYRENAIIIDATQSYDRNTIALKKWVELGEQYTPAIEALRNIRDDNVLRLMEGEANAKVFEDIVAINEYLKESKRTAEIFKWYDAIHPEFAASIYGHSEKALFEAQEYSLAKKYSGNLELRYSKVKSDFQKDLSEKMSSESPKKLEKNFSDQVVMLITMLEKYGDLKLARKIQADALSILENASSIKAAITDDGIFDGFDIRERFRTCTIAFFVRLNKSDSANNVKFEILYSELNTNEIGKVKRHGVELLRHGVTRAPAILLFGEIKTDDPDVLNPVAWNSHIEFDDLNKIEVFLEAEDMIVKQVSMREIRDFFRKREKGVSVKFP